MHKRETLGCLRDARNTELRKSHMKNDEVKKVLKIIKHQFMLQRSPSPLIFPAV
jgi:hypothetical protein